MSHFKKGEKTQSKPQHGGSHCGSQRVYVRLWFRNHATRMPSTSTTLVILMLFVSRSCIHSCWFSVARPVILALNALCKLQGGPLWCLAESDPVLLLGCTDRTTLLFSAELQDHWLKSTHTYQKTSAISHVYLTWATPGQSVLWWSAWMDKTGPNICPRKKKRRWHWKQRCNWPSFSLSLSSPYLDRLLPCIPASLLLLLFGKTAWHERNQLQHDERQSKTQRIHYEKVVKGIQEKGRRKLQI